MLEGARPQEDFGEVTHEWASEEEQKLTGNPSRLLSFLPVQAQPGPDFPAVKIAAISWCCGSPAQGRPPLGPEVRAPGPAGRSCLGRYRRFPVAPPHTPCRAAPWATPWAWPWLAARDPIDPGHQVVSSTTLLVVDPLPSGSEAWQRGSSPWRQAALLVLQLRG